MHLELSHFHSMYTLLKLVVLVLGLLGANALTWKNLDCDGKACMFQVKDIVFNTYSLVVKGYNTANHAIPGGEVQLDVQIKFLFTWIDAYSSTDPTCSYEGSDCKDGIIVGPNAEKTLVLTMSETPPSGNYRGWGEFYYLNEEDTAKISYASVYMEWKCDSSRCI